MPPKGTPSVVVEAADHARQRAGLELAHLARADVAAALSVASLGDEGDQPHAGPLPRLRTVRAPARCVSSKTVQCVGSSAFGGRRSVAAASAFTKSQDGGLRAEVRAEREVAPEALAHRVEHRDVGAAKAVDRLLLVADDEERHRVPREGPHEPGLDCVRVLELVDQDGAEAARVPVAYRRMPRQHGVRLEDQVVEREHAVRVAACADRPRRRRRGGPRRPRSARALPARPSAPGSRRRACRRGDRGRALTWWTTLAEQPDQPGQSQDVRARRLPAEPAKQRAPMRATPRADATTPCARLFPPMTSSILATTRSRRVADGLLRGGCARRLRRRRLDDPLRAAPCDSEAARGAA